MKLFRHGAIGQERPGLIDAHGIYRDLSGVVDDITGATLTKQMQQRLRTLDTSRLPALPAAIRLGPCIARVHNFIGLGLNFADHAAEANLPIPKHPLVFNKAPTCIAGPHDPLLVPPGSRELDYEVEMAVVLCEDAWQVSEARALDYVGGYCLCNDFSDRYWQNQFAGQWTIGKSAPGFGPLGPWLVTADDIPNPADIQLALSVNTQRKQYANTSGMIFNVAQVIAYISRFFRLSCGDVITMGTPAGVGLATGNYLRPGDKITASGGILGEQHIQILAG